MKTRMNFSVPRTRTTTGAASANPADQVGPLDRLPPAEKEVVILSSFYGLAKDEIAAVVGASVDAVDHLLNQAMTHLQRLLISRRGPLTA